MPSLRVLALSVTAGVTPAVAQHLQTERLKPDYDANADISSDAISNAPEITASPSTSEAPAASSTTETATTTSKPPSRSPLKDSCDHAVSRRVRHELQRRFFAPLVQHGFMMNNETYFPMGCPFLPSNDAYAVVEASKKRLRPGSGAGGPFANWECAICGKKFRSEHYIDLHMETAHWDKRGYFCLADMCEALGVW